MRKCDSCGKVVVDNKEYMCPRCGAVIQKHCDHSTHLPDDKYNRANDYRAIAAEHKSETYSYEKAPKTDASNKFDINDLANIKNAEDAKRVAKKAFIEQDKNGKKKFKPLAIVLIVIFAVNIFGNILSGVFDAVDSAFEELDSAFAEELVVGEETLIHSFVTQTYVDSGAYDRENDCLTINIEEMYFEYYGTHDEYYEENTDEWQDDFSFPGNYISESRINLSLAIYDEDDVQIVGFDDQSYNDSVDLAAELTENGELKIYGIKSHIRNMTGKDVYCNISDSVAKAYNYETYEQIEYSFDFPFNYIKISTDDTVTFCNIYMDYENESENIITEADLTYRYVPDEYIDHVNFDDSSIFDLPVSVEYTEMVTIVD